MPPPSLSPEKGQSGRVLLRPQRDHHAASLADFLTAVSTEVIRRAGPWRSIEAVEFATLEWVAWFNHRRLLEPIGNIPPAEAEANYHAELATRAVAA